MTRLRSSILVGLLLVALSTLSRPASAGPDEEARQRAAQSYRGAQAAFARKDYAAAAAAFESAAEFVPHPAALLAGADAWERAGEPVRAAEACDRALALPNLKAASAKDSVDYARDANDCVARNARKIATLEVVGPSSTALRIDGGAQEIPPLRRRLRPGRHAVQAVDLRTSRAWSLEVVIGGGETKQLDATPPEAPTSPSRAAAKPPPAEEREPAPKSGGGPPTASWIAFGVAGAGAIASGVFTAMLIDARSSYQSHPTQSGRDTFQRDVILTDVGIGVTAVAAAAGLAFWLLAPREPVRGSNRGALRF